VEKYYNMEAYMVEYMVEYMVREGNGMYMIYHNYYVVNNDDAS